MTFINLSVYLSTYLKSLDTFNLPQFDIRFDWIWRIKYEQRRKRKNEINRNKWVYFFRDSFNLDWELVCCGFHYFIVVSLFIRCYSFFLFIWYWTFPLALVRVRTEMNIPTKKKTPTRSMSKSFPLKSAKWIMHTIWILCAFASHRIEVNTPYTQQHPNWTCCAK